VTSRRLACLVAAALAQGAEATAQGGDAPAVEPPDGPFLRVDLPETEAIPGQFLTLRLTVLVPSFMPDPPVWPSLEAPNLLVRVPERGTSPTSERIGGSTWSGVTRRYRIAPMVPGTFELPPQEVVVTWADPDADQPARVALSTGPLAFAGVLPEGAEGLDPFIAASGLTLAQEIAGAPGAMTPGDSLTRTVTAEVAGLSPMFLPDLLGPGAVPGLAAYPDAPRLAETDDRGTLGGTRSESVTYVAGSGGGGTLPAVSLDWWDVDTGAIRTATVDAVEVAIDGPPSAPANRETRQRRLLIGAGALAVALLAALVLRRAWRPLRRRLAARRAARQAARHASEPHAWRILSRTVARRDHAALYPALDAWAARLHRPDPRRDARVQAALTALGQTRYGRPERRPGGAGDAWRDLGAALRAARRRADAPRTPHALPPLNPGVPA
jgi:hypothetical protein